MAAHPHSYHIIPIVVELRQCLQTVCLAGLQARIAENERIIVCYWYHAGQSAVGGEGIGG